jgi:[ribosomal protein S18]-alanine N-acetyltransferase
MFPALHLIISGHPDRLSEFNSLMPECMIRKMTESDLPIVVEVEKITFSDPWSFASFKSDLKNEMAFPLIAELENKVAGYSCNYVVADEMQIGNFAVAPDFRGQGIAKMLMDEIIKIAIEKKCDSIFLEVRESNTPARTLYQAFGFKPIGRRVDYYRNPKENAIIMVKEL